MDFKNAEELLKLCETNHCSISEIMKQREIELGETSADAVEKKMAHTLEIMRESAYTPIRKPQKSIGGLIGGEAKLLRQSQNLQEKYLWKCVVRCDHLCHGDSGG